MSRSTPYPKRPKNGAPRFKTVNESLSWWMKHQRLDVLKQSQEKMARRTNLARATYANYELGKRTPTLKDFVRICEALYLPYEVVIDDADWLL